MLNKVKGYHFDGKHEDAFQGEFSVAKVE